MIKISEKDFEFLIENAAEYILEECRAEFITDRFTKIIDVHKENISSDCLRNIGVCAIDESLELYNLALNELGFR